MRIDSFGDGFGDYEGGGCGNGYNIHIISHGAGSGGNSYGIGCAYDHGYGTGLRNGDGFGDVIDGLAYHMTPFAYLTYEGEPLDNTFENFAFHLQVEPLVHRRMG